MLARAAPDIVAFEQFADVEDGVLSMVLAGQYPFRSWSAGLALYSRWPTRVTRTTDFHDDAHGRLLAAEIDVDGRMTRVIVVHLTSPRNGSRMSANRREALALVEEIRRSPLPTIVVGDFNAPLGSPTVDAVRVAGLEHVDHRAGWGSRWTWMPGHALPMARIDHAFVSSEFGVVDSRVLGRVGSDHLPILVDLRFR